ncbi:unnamed protein product [Blepharisma stoltei]|uniref:Histidine kinase n=1 Tax=Blepharisma stoltei TaxID=1481888 RepID=A0AAU9K415_9CILI|nr:unnamed protein product [Blepharisma stoltei]
MEKVEDLWWEDEVNEKYQLLKKFMYSLWVIGVSLLVFLNVFFDSFFEFLPIHLPYLIIHSIGSFGTWLIGTKSVTYKCLYSILYSEYAGFVFWTMGNYEWRAHSMLFEMISLIFINSFELPFVRKGFFKTLIIFKHIFLWYYLKSVTGEQEFSVDHMPHLIAFLTLFLYNLNSYYLKEKSLNRFTYRRNLEIAEERLGLLLNLHTDGILVFSESSVLYTNIHTTRLLGCRPCEIINELSKIEYCNGKKYSSLTSSNKLMDDVHLIHVLPAGEEVMLGICQRQGNNLEWKGRKLMFEGSECVLLSIRDVNHMIQLEQTISDNTLKNVLLRSVSHELRTPINAITFLTDSLICENNTIERELCKLKLDMISLSSKLLLSLVNDLLDYSKMITGAFSIKKAKFRLYEVINDAIQLIKLQAEKKGLTLILRYDPSLPQFVFSDSLRLKQALLNLLSNSLKFTIKGSIEVICIMGMKGKLKIKVKDTGIGISENKINDLFKEFNTERHETLNPQGCGLGLYISSRIVKDLGGDSVKVKSQIDVGSSFSFEIDIFEENSLDPHQYESGKSFSTDEQNFIISPPDFQALCTEKEPTSVLIADDNDINRIMLGNLLSKYKISFDEACTGKEAIRLVEKMSKLNRPYKVIIMDGSMPELNGWDVSNLINRMYFEYEISYLPVIIGYTAFNSEEEITLCYQSGMSYCLLKPCNPDELISTIRKYI